MGNKGKISWVKWINSWVNSKNSWVLNTISNFKTKKIRVILRFVLHKACHWRLILFKTKHWIFNEWLSFVIFIIRTVFLPEKVMKFALGLFLNEISNLPPFLAARYLAVIRWSTLKNYGGSIDMSACFLIALSWTF